MSFPPISFHHCANPRLWPAISFPTVSLCILLSCYRSSFPAVSLHLCPQALQRSHSRLCSSITHLQSVIFLSLLRISPSISLYPSLFSASHRVFISLSLSSLHLTRQENMQQLI